MTKRLKIAPGTKPVKLSRKETAKWARKLAKLADAKVKGSA
jgi:hypothetical protein